MREWLSAKHDLYACFIERAVSLCRGGGAATLVTMHGWMFIGSYADFRRSVVLSRFIASLMHLGPHAFEEISGEKVQVAAFTLIKAEIDGVTPYVDLLDDGDKEAAFRASAPQKTHFVMKEVFSRFEGVPLIYSASQSLLKAINGAPLFRDVAESKIGLQTGDNDIFIRNWFEVSFDETYYFAADSSGNGKKWFFHNKGGENVRWYFYPKHVVLWGNDGEAIKNDKKVKLSAGLIEKKNSGCWNEAYYLRPGISYTRMSSGNLMCYAVPKGVMFDTAAPTIFGNISQAILILLLNSTVVRKLARMFNPTLSFQKGDLERMPVLFPSNCENVENIYNDIQNLCKRNESRYEVYPAFLSDYRRFSSISECYADLNGRWCLIS